MTTPTDPTAALKLARDALAAVVGSTVRPTTPSDGAALNAGRAALAAIDALPAPSGEPVAEIAREGVLWLNTNPHRLPIGTKLYAGATAQAAPAPLPAFRVSELLIEAGYSDAAESAHFINGLRNGEAAHGITAAPQAPQPGGQGA